MNDPGPRSSLADRAHSVHHLARLVADGGTELPGRDALERLMAATADLRARVLELRGAPADLLVDCGQVERVVRDLMEADDTFAAFLREELLEVAGRVAAQLVDSDGTASDERALAS